MIAASEMSCACTRHSLALIRLPAVSLASAGILLMMTDIPGAGSSTMTPSRSGSLMGPLLSRTINVGAGLRCVPPNSDAFTDCQVGRPANALSSTRPWEPGSTTTKEIATRTATDTATANLAAMPTDGRS